YVSEGPPPGEREHAWAERGKAGAGDGSGQRTKRAPADEKRHRNSEGKTQPMSAGAGPKQKTDESEADQDIFGTTVGRSVGCEQRERCDGDRGHPNGEALAVERFDPTTRLGSSDPPAVLQGDGRGFAHRVAPESLTVRGSAPC